MMRPCTVFLAIALLGFTCARAFSQEPTNERAPATGCTLRIHVDGLRNDVGKVGTVLFSSPDGWPEDLSKSFRRGPTDIAPGEKQAMAIWDHLPPGDYGVAAIRQIYK